jgi:hypothetical protein
LTLAFMVLFALCVPALASDTGLSGLEGHPRARFPLTVGAPPLGDARLGAVLRRAVEDWNTVFREAFGREAFVWGERRETAQVTLAIEPSTSPDRMGETHVRAEDTGVIALPVRIVASRRRGQTSRRRCSTRSLRELGHSPGQHARDPRSLMCCVPGSVDFNDPSREAYRGAPPSRWDGARPARGTLPRFWQARLKATRWIAASG